MGEVARAFGKRIRSPRAPASGLRIGTVCALALTLCAAPGWVRAASKNKRTAPGISPETCVLAHERGLDLSDHGDWLGASAAFRRCVETACPRVVQKECGAELSRLRQRIPSVVFAARDTLGQDLIGVRVYSNRRLLLDQLGTASVPMNPGRYRFDLVGPNGATVSRDVLLREGEIDRRVEAVFPVGGRLDPGGAYRTASAVWTVPVTLCAATAATGLAVFGLFALRGKSTEDCKPACSEEQVHDLRRDYLIADIALGVSVVAAGTAALLVWRQTRDTPPVAAHVSVRRGGAAVGAQIGF